MAKGYQPTIILGIDPGLATIGFGCLRVSSGRPEMVEAGLITTPAKRPLPERLNMIYKDMTALIANLKPDIVSVEKLFFNQNITTGIEVGSCRGVILLTAQQAQATIVEIAPLQVKMTLTGWGRASKKQVQIQVQKMLGLNERPKPDDLADALGLALVASRQI